MKNKAGIIHIILILFIGVFVIAIGFIVFYFNKNSEEILILESEEIIEEDIGVNWKTHTNDTVGFSFEYPKDFKVDDDNNDYYFSLTSPAEEKRRVMAITNDDLKMEIIIGDNSENFTLSEYVADTKKTINGEILKEKEVQIGGIQAILLDTDFMGLNRGYFLVKDSYLIYVVKYPLKSAFDEVFENIISSFVFF